MKFLYAPWREDYSSAIDKASKQSDASQAACVFCKQLAENNDEKNLIIKRFHHNYVLLNKYPYNAGHILILPLEHHAELSELSLPARIELIELINSTIELMQTTLNPHGFNVGFNLGKEAGAGIPSHLHAHVLPRWQGDTNFLPTLADTKQISFDLHKIYERLKMAFEQKN